MVNFGTYVGLVITLSLLLAMVGVPTVTHNLIDRFMSITPNTVNGGFSVDPTGFNKDGKQLLISLFGISAVIFGAIAIRSALGGTFGIAESLKIAALTTLLGLILSDLYGIFIFLNSVEDFSGITRYIAFIIYIPIAIMTIISGLDWIGGGR